MSFQPHECYKRAANRNRDVICIRDRLSARTVRDWRTHLLASVPRMTHPATRPTLSVELYLVDNGGLRDVGAALENWMKVLRTRAMRFAQAAARSRARCLVAAVITTCQPMK